MNLQVIKNAVSSRVGRQLLTVQKHSPTVMFVAGTVGVVATVALACRATLKVDEVLEGVEKTKALIETVEHEDYSEKDKQQDLAKLYAKTGLAFIKLYGPAVIVGAASIACLTGAHVVLSKRNVGLSAAYAALDRAYKEYQKRVSDEFGAEKERELRFGSQKREIVEETKEGPVTKEISTYDPNGYSAYARFYDELNPNWQRVAEYNLLFLKCQQNYANDLLHSRGHVFLNEVYDMLGIDRSKAGSVVGWVLGKGNDNFVDFGVFEHGNPRAIDFVNGREGAILLDFNVDGVIYDKI